MKGKSYYYLSFIICLSNQYQPSNCLSTKRSSSACTRRYWQQCTPWQYHTRSWCPHQGRKAFWHACPSRTTTWIWTHERILLLANGGLLLRTPKRKKGRFYWYTGIGPLITWLFKRIIVILYPISHNIILWTYLNSVNKK